MTTENNLPRDIGTHLSLETYQGMTDEEINIVIEFKIKTEVMRKMGESDNAMSTLIMVRQISDNAESCRMAHDALQSILGRGPVLQSVEVNNV